MHGEHFSGRRLVERKEEDEKKRRLERVQVSVTKVNTMQL